MLSAGPIHHECTLSTYDCTTVYMSWTSQTVLFWLNMVFLSYTCTSQFHVDNQSEPTIRVCGFATRWLFCILLSWPLCVWAYDLQYTHLISYTCSCMATYWPPMSQSCSQSAHRLSEQKREKTKTTTPFGANWVRSQVLYRAAQALSEVPVIAQTAAACMRES